MKPYIERLEVKNNLVESMDQETLAYRCEKIAIIGFVFAGLLSAFVSATLSEQYSLVFLRTFSGSISWLLPRVIDENNAIELAGQSSSMQMFNLLNNYLCLVFAIVTWAVFFNRARKAPSPKSHKKFWTTREFLPYWPFCIAFLAYFVFFHVGALEGTSRLSRSYIPGYLYTVFPVGFFSGFFNSCARVTVAVFDHLNHKRASNV